MKKFYRLLAMILAAVIIAAAVAVTCTAKTIYEVDGYTCGIISQSSVSICGWDDRSPELVIPMRIDDRFVSEIDDLAFQNDTVLTSVDLTPAALLESIGVYAFSGCENLGGTVVFSGRLRAIGDSAFEHCTSLSGVTFYTKNLTVIPPQCFDGCSNLSAVQLPDNLRQIEKYAFADCVSLSSIEIPTSVTDINPTAFDNCNDIVLQCYSGSYAQTFAEQYNYDYELLDAPEPPTEPETDEPTDAPVEVTFILGDADGDGKITILDATKIQRVLVALDDDLDGMITLRGSCGRDELDILHATHIQRWLAGYLVADPIGTTVTRTITAE